MLTFNLKKQWFDKIKSGEKTHEYREVKPYWTRRIANIFVANNIKKFALSKTGLAKSEELVDLLSIDKGMKQEAIYKNL